MLEILLRFYIYVGVCVCVCVCLCVPGIYHVMGTNCAHKYSNTSKIGPCGDNF